MSQHFLLSARARTLSLAQVMRMTNQEGGGRLYSGPMARWEASLPALRMPHRLGLPQSEWRSALALQGVPQKFLGYQRHVVRVP
jgi:hypothetical protein